MGNGWVSLYNDVYGYREENLQVKLDHFSLPPGLEENKKNLSNEHLESNHTQPLTDSSKTRSSSMKKFLFI